MADSPRSFMLKATMVKVKNCGLRTPESIRESFRSGASFVGFVHHAASPRHLAITDMASLIAATPTGLATVAVLVNPDDALLDALLASTHPDYLQLHGVAEPARIAAVRARYHVPVISAHAIRRVEDLTAARAFEEVSEYLLFDAPQPGSGEAFDWSLLGGLAIGREWFLAGGLTPANVTEAIRLTHAPMVDVSSGIEDSPGVKSLEKIAAFNRAVLHATA